MNAVYILAHFDDEYGALPLLLRDLRDGVRPWLLYVADYGTAALSATRLAETRALLASLGVDPARALHVGGGTGVMDGGVIDGLPRAFAAIRAAIDAIGAVERLTVAAWEGGHPDHDACAFLAVRLRDGLPGSPPIEQFALYNGRGLPAPLFAAGAPTPENGPMIGLPLTIRQWAFYAAAVRFFPSQAKTWAGLWPAMFASFLRRGGFAFQHLDPARVLERPHAGPLLYERMFKTPYERVRARLDDFDRTPSRP